MYFFFGGGGGGGVNNFILQGCVKLVERDGKDLYRFFYFYFE